MLNFPHFDNFVYALFLAYITKNGINCCNLSWLLWNILQIDEIVVFNSYVFCIYILITQINHPSKKFTSFNIWLLSLSYWIILLYSCAARAEANIWKERAKQFYVRGKQFQQLRQQPHEDIYQERPVSGISAIWSTIRSTGTWLHEPLAVWN